MMDKVRKDKFIVLQRTRLVDFLLEQCSFLRESSQVNDFLARKLIRCNNKTCLYDCELEPGDVVVLLTPQEDEPVIDASYDIVYEDEDVLVVNKSGNLPVHPVGKYHFNTLTSLLAQDGHGKTFFPIHRLDRQTSGLILFAQHRKAAQALQDLQRTGGFAKAYACIVYGVLERSTGEFDFPLLQADTASFRHAVLVSKKGKSARTSYEVKETSRDGRFSLVNVALLRGRKHQIRVHFAHAGHALVGDEQYRFGYQLFQTKRSVERNSSDKEVKFTGVLRQMLHCGVVEFLHPRTGKRLCFKTRLPSDMRSFLKQHGFLTTEVF